MGKKRFCFLMHFHPVEGRFGGAEIQAWLLAKELARRGHEVWYTAQSLRGKPGLTEVIDGVNVFWVRYAKYFMWARGLDYYRALKKIVPDIVVQRYTSFATGIAGHYCRKFSKDFAWICTDNSIPRRWHFVKQRRAINRVGKSNILKKAIFLVNSVIYDLSRHYGMKRVTRAFTQNDQQSALLKEQFGLDSRRIISGHEPPETVASPEERLSAGIVLWVANLAPRKRPDVFVELARRCADMRLRFVMIGSRADESYLDELFKDKPDNLEWLGRLAFDETLTWFDRAAFFVNTSEDTGEGFPNTYIQAWLRGVPVISFGVDPDNVIAENGLGSVVGGVSEAKNILEQMLDGEQRHKELLDRAASYAIAHHTVAVMTDNFLKELNL